MNTVLYVGVTSDLKTRLAQHQNKTFLNAFSAKYNCDKLVYYETFERIEDAIKREKAIKKWNREWKDKLIGRINPEWNDLSVEILSW